MEKKRNKALTLTLVLLLLVMVTLGTLGGTFAKYTSSASGTDSARVAKWSFTVNDTDIVKEDEFELNLFATAYSNVESSNSDKLVAPGTEGAFELVLNNKAEVVAEYTVSYEVTNDAGIPILFSVDGGQSWTATLAEATEELAANTGTKTIKIEWKWDETSSDAADTALGAEGTDTITVKATVVAEQVLGA